MTNILLTALLAVVLGFMIASSQPAVAGGGKAIVIMPPTLNTGQSPTLTTGYHNSPSALDWDDSGSNPKVFIRTFGIADFPTPTDIALAVATDKTIAVGCYTTAVTFYEAGTWVNKGEIQWWHTLPRWQNIYKVIHGDDTWAHLDNKHLANTTTDFLCTSTGTHVHETFAAVDDRNTGLYPSGDCPCSPPTYKNNNIAHWTMIVSW